MGCDLSLVKKSLRRNYQIKHENEMIADSHPTPYQAFWSTYEILPVAGGEN